MKKTGRPLKIVIAKVDGVEIGRGTIPDMCHRFGLSRSSMSRYINNPGEKMGDIQFVVDKKDKMDDEVFFEYFTKEWDEITEDLRALFRKRRCRSPYRTRI